MRYPRRRRRSETMAYWGIGLMIVGIIAMLAVWVVTVPTLGPGAGYLSALVGVVFCVVGHIMASET